MMTPGIVSARFSRAAVVLFAAALSACAALEPAPDYRNVIVSADRTDADRTLDQRREPQKLLEFYGVRPGMRVLDMSAGRGYNAELLARVVGQKGRVYAQSSPSISFPATKAAMEERLKTPAMKNVVYVEREFEDPVPPDVRNLDLVTFNFNYHDTVWLGTDRARMNRAVFEALKPGGVFIVADHSAKPGAGAGVTKSLHRIEESLVRSEVQAAGFRLVESATFLRNPEDTRELPVSKNTVRNDEFVLKFVKP
jgi:predicted methyltransferase